MKTIYAINDSAALENMLHDHSLSFSSFFFIDFSFLFPFESIFYNFISFIFHELTLNGEAFKN